MIKIKKLDWIKIIDYIQSALPNEACGLLAGHNGTVSDIYLIKNVDENPRIHYMLDPQGQFLAMKDMRNKNTDMLAIFHSHPESPAYPSPTDIALACHPETYYIIISLKEREQPEPHAFKIINGTITEFPIQIESDII